MTGVGGVRKQNVNKDPREQISELSKELSSNSTIRWEKLLSAKIVC